MKSFCVSILFLVTISGSAQQVVYQAKKYITGTTTKIIPPIRVEGLDTTDVLIGINKLDKEITIQQLGTFKIVLFKTDKRGTFFVCKDDEKKDCLISLFLKTKSVIIILGSTEALKYKPCPFIAYIIDPKPIYH